MVPPKQALLVIALALGCLLVALIVWQTTSSVSSWTTQTVRVPFSTNASNSTCYTVNSSLHVDRFCMSIIATPGAAFLNGTFDHGWGNNSSARFELSNDATCHTGCPTSATWTSPDGTGRVVWQFSTFLVTIESFD